MLKNVCKPFSVFTVTKEEQSEAYLIQMNEREFVLYDFFTIKQYEDDKVLLVTKNQLIKINGRNLSIKKMTANSIYIAGSITSVEYVA